MRSAKRGSCISVDYRFMGAPPAHYPFIDTAKIAIFRDMTKCSRCYLHARNYVMQHLLTGRQDAIGGIAKVLEILIVNNAAILELSNILICIMQSMHVR